MNEDLTTDLDAPPSNGLDDIFVLPEDIAADPRIVGWYNEMVTQLRREAQGVPMKAAQYTLMERICYFYAYMRYQEFTNPAMPGREKLQNIAAWQTMLDQFNRLLEKHNDKIVQDMLLQVQDIVKNVLNLVKDPDERQFLRRRLNEEFAAVEL